MPIADENRVREILTRFVRETIPDYIVENSAAIVESDGVQKLDVQQRDQFLDVDGPVQGDERRLAADHALRLDITEPTRLSGRVGCLLVGSITAA